jgi:NAD(P)H-hydrate epimerase
MRIITSELGRQIDAYTMESEPIASIELVKRASRLSASCISGVTERNVPCVFLVGPGYKAGIRWYFFMHHMKPESFFLSP